jgi:hypothetical protein
MRLEEEIDVVNSLKDKGEKGWMEGKATRAREL